MASVFAPVGQTQLNDTQRTMIEQLHHQNQLWRGEFGVRMIVIMDENTLRFPMRIGRHKVNVDLKYEEGDDLYRITAWDIDAFTRKVCRIEGEPTEEAFNQAKRDTTIFDEGGLFWDQLYESLRSIASKVDR